MHMMCAWMCFVDHWMNQLGCLHAYDVCMDVLCGSLGESIRMTACI